MQVQQNRPIFKLITFAGCCFAELLLLTAPAHGQTLYQFGNPTGDEQLYIELINRARANPTAEGARLATTTDPDVIAAMNYYAVNKTMMQSEFAALPVAPPLAPSANLTTAARGHSLWMFNTATQSHNQSATNTPSTRITASGYVWSNVSENIYAYSKSTWFGHAGLQVDWGTGGTGGMQAGRGHRVAIHNSVLREIGVGVHLGTNGAVGPQLVTQDFGKQMSNPTLGTGVAYYDLNGNNFYDSNEGISGLTVNIAGASHYCTTATGGGWAVPVPTTAGTRAVTFSGLNVNQTTNLTFSANTNAKLDLKLTYAPPTITSPPTASAGSPHNLTFTPVGGATSYEWNTWNTVAAAAENCNSLSTITSTTTGTYSVLNTAIKHEGTGAFKLENSTGSNQSFQLNSLFYGGTSPTISFQSRLRYAAVAETFRVQVKEEGTTTWLTVDSQTGTNGPGSSVFTLRSAPLTGMSGKAFRIRFLLNSSGSYYALSGNTYGWFVDAINFTGVSSLQNNVKQSLASNSGSFSPSAGSYLMAVAPVISGNPFAGSYQSLVVTAATLPVITTQPTSLTINSGSTATFTVAATGPSLTYQWYQGTSGETANPISLATSSSYTTPSLGSNGSYWVRVSNGAGNVNSNTVTATVIQPPNITSQPNPVSVTAGSSATFTVGATGTSLSYQWFQGNTGITTNPISLATSSSYTTPPISQSGNYWVRVSNSAGVLNSNTVAVTLIIPPVIVHQPDSTEVIRGQSATLVVVASGTAPNIQWFEGNSGDTSSPLLGATSPELNTPVLTEDATYWARAANSAGTAISDTAVVTVMDAFTSWARNLEIANGLPEGSVSNANGDADHDGRSNLVEYAFGSSPLISSDPAPRMPVAETTGTHLIMRYQRDTSLLGVQLTPQACPVLGAWKAPGVAGAVEGFTDTLISTQGTIETREAKIPLSSGSNCFMRMQVSQP